MSKARYGHKFLWQCFGLTFTSSHIDYIKKLSNKHIVFVLSWMNQYFLCDHLSIYACYLCCLPDCSTLHSTVQFLCTFDLLMWHYHHMRLVLKRHFKSLCSRTLLTSSRSGRNCKICNMFQFCPSASLYFGLVLCLDNLIRNCEWFIVTFPIPIHLRMHCLYQ